MEHVIIIILLVSIPISICLGIFVGYLAFGKDDGEQYYQGYLDGLDKAYTLHDLDRAILKAQEEEDRKLAKPPTRVLKM